MAPGMRARGAHLIHPYAVEDIGAAFVRKTT
jgi:hypothetical protein